MRSILTRGNVYFDSVQYKSIWYHIICFTWYSITHSTHFLLIIHSLVVSPPPGIDLSSFGQQQHLDEAVQLNSGPSDDALVVCALKCSSPALPEVCL